MENTNQFTGVNTLCDISDWEVPAAWAEMAEHELLRQIDRVCQLQAAAEAVLADNDCSSVYITDAGVYPRH